jgi:lysophospholipase L1-like esterase
MRDAEILATGTERPQVLRTRSYKFISILLGLLAAFLFGEIVLRLVLPSQDRYYAWPPNLKVTLEPNSEFLPGISGRTRLTTSSDGIRGDEITTNQMYRILAVGGSTTECFYLDDTEAWPYLLQMKLSESKMMPIWVGNTGRAGLNTRDHLLQLKYLLPQYPKIDAAILLVGSNDLHIRIADRNYDPLYTAKPTFEAEYKRRAFSLVPSNESPYHHTRLGWWRMAKRLKNGYLDKVPDLPIMDPTGASLATWRRYRKTAPTITDDVPDLSSALEEYRHNLETMVDIARARSVRLIFVTQPTMWRLDLPQEEMDLLWGGGVDKFQLGLGKKYYSPASLEKSMQKYNDTLLDVCLKRAVDCIDLAKVLPKDKTVFYDDVHFNESGARQVAEALFRYIDQRVLPR